MSTPDAIFLGVMLTLLCGVLFGGGFCIGYAYGQQSNKPGAPKQ